MVSRIEASNEVSLSTDPSLKALPERRSNSHPDRRETDTLRLENSLLREALSKNFPADQLISILQEANEQLVASTFGAQDREAESQAYNKRLEEFLAMLAHELRNPLAAVSGAAHVLGYFQNAHPELPKLQKIITRQIAHVARIVEDLLDASRVNSGRVHVKKEILNLEDVIDAAVETSKHIIERYGHHLTFNKPDSSLLVQGDPIRLSQVFSNLVANACKFTTNGGAITISVTTAGANANVTIQDHGIGMSSETLEVIFDLFAQGTATLDRSQGGLGIGLSLVRSILTLHSGTVEAKSEGVGKGSIFTVTLPLASGSAFPAAAPAVLLKANSQRILIIEDNFDALDSLTDLLTLEGHVVDSAESGLSGLNLATSNTYDIIICDIGLPEIDGFEVASRYLASCPTHPSRLIALSGYDQPNYRDKALSCGFDHYLVKPVSLADLSAHIRSQ